MFETERGPRRHLEVDRSAISVGSGIGLAGRWRVVKNPLADPLAHVKEPLSRGRRGKPKVEFEPFDVQHIRAGFGMTQRAFASLIGISVETLRNWEEGRRRPHGPSRALLRVLDADPFLVARVLNWHATRPLEEPEEWRHR